MTDSIAACYLLAVLVTLTVALIVLGFEIVRWHRRPAERRRRAIRRIDQASRRRLPWRPWRERDPSRRYVR